MNEIRQRRHFLARASAAAAALTVGPPAFAQANWPQSPVKMIIPFAAGGSTDILTRMIGKIVGERIGQPIVVDNRGGAYGAIGSVEVTRAAPDGHTLLFGNNGLLTVTPTLQPSSHYTHRSFTPVSLVATTPFILAVHPRVTARNLQEFFSYARAQPGGVNFASAGGIIDLTTDLLAKGGKIDIVKIPYKGTVDGMNALAAGDVHAMITTPSQVLKRGFRMRRMNEDAQHGSGMVLSPERIPVWLEEEGEFSCYFVGGYVRRAEREGDVVLTDIERQALEELAAVSESPEFYLDMQFSEGDIQFLNNRAILHGRSDYSDGEDLYERRHLIRLWLRLPQWPAYPSAQVFHSDLDRERWARRRRPMMDMPSVYLASKAAAAAGAVNE